MWYKEWGAHLETLLLKHRNGTPVECIINRPIPLDGLNFYIQGYKDLKADRSIGMSVGKIPWSSIIKWCEIHDIHDINDKDSVIRYFRAMEDAEYDFDQGKNKKD